MVAPTPYLATATQLVAAIESAGSDFRLAEIARGTVTGTLAARRGRPVVHRGPAHLRPTHGRRLGARGDEVARARRRHGGRDRRGGARREEGLGVFVVPGDAVAATPVPVIDPTMPLASVRLDDVRGRGRARARRAGRPVGRRRRRPGAAGGDDGAVAVDRGDLPGDLRDDARSTRRTVSSSAGRSARSRPLKHRLADCYLAVERAAALAYFAALTIAEDDDRRGRGRGHGQGGGRRLPAPRRP